MKGLNENSSVGRFTLSDDKVIRQTVDKTMNDEFNNCWTQRPVFDFEFETYESYVNRTSQ